MKRYYNSILAMLALASIISACEDGLKAGDTLYPVEEENYDARVYINEIGYADNTVTYNLIHNTLLDEIFNFPESFEFYLHITKPVDKDVTVTVALDSESCATYSNDYTRLSESTVSLANTSVTIPAGKMVSTEPVVIRFTSGSEIKDMVQYAVAAVKIASISTALEDVHIGKDHNTLFTCFEKESVASNIKGQDSNDLNSLEQIPYENYVVSAYSWEGEYTYGAWEGTSNLSDESSKTYVGYEYGYLDIYATFNSEETISGLSFCYGQNVGWCPMNIEILTSNDGENWVSQGEFVNEVFPSKSTQYIPIVFYSGVKCKYVDFFVSSTYWSYYYGDYYFYPCVSEMKLYK